jgi:acyl-CoA thioester hydrolase
MRVDFGETDAAGIVFYPNFFRWQDRYAHQFFHALGYPISKQLSEHHIAWPIVEAKCTFHQPLFFDDEIEVITRLEHIGEKSIRLSHVFEKSGNLVASGYEVRVCTVFKPGEIPYGIEIPDWLVVAMKQD